MKYKITIMKKIKIFKVTEEIDYGPTSIDFYLESTFKKWFLKKISNDELKMETFIFELLTKETVLFSDCISEIKIEIVNAFIDLDCEFYIQTKVE